MPMGLGASFNRVILKSIGMSLEAGGLYSCQQSRGEQDVVSQKQYSNVYALTQVLCVSNWPESWS